MGTRGFRLVRFRGRYYSYYNNMDSYPEYLGCKIVASIPKDPKEFAKWFEEQCSYYSKVEQVLGISSLSKGENSINYRAVYNMNGEDNFQLVPPPTAANVSLPSKDQEYDYPPDINLRSITLPERMPDYFPELNTLFIEWVYIIDLDRKVFSVQNKFHFRLDCIPENWVEGINIVWNDAELDSDFLKFLKYLVGLSPEKPTASPSDLLFYDSLDTTLLRIPTEEVERSPSAMLKRNLFWTFTSQCRYLDLVPQLSADSAAFKQLAFMLLCLADADHSIDMTRREPPERRMKFIERYFRGPYPSNTSFTFAGTFVHFTTHLDDPYTMKAAIAEAVRSARESKNAIFTVILFSIRHVVIVEQSHRQDHNGVHSYVTQHTPALPFIPCHSKYISLEWERYRSAQEIEGNNEEWVGFNAVSYTFALRRGTSVKHSISQHLPLPSEILLRIIELSDYPTWKTLRNTTRQFRDLCTRSATPRVGSYTLKSGTSSGFNWEFVAVKEGSGEKIILEMPATLEDPGEPRSRDSPRYRELFVEKKGKVLDPKWDRTQAVLRYWPETENLCLPWYILKEKKLPRGS